MLTYLNIYGATHQESEDGAEDEEEVPVIGFWSGFVWLVGMTIIIALLSEYVVATIEVKKKSHFHSACVVENYQMECSYFMHCT